MNEEERLILSDDLDDVLRGIDKMTSAVYERVSQNLDAGGDGKGHVLDNTGSDYLADYQELDDDAKHAFRSRLRSYVRSGSHFNNL
jgi:molybdenum-dependent DNA-binding transcriptional regulator ModE